MSTTLRAVSLSFAVLCSLLPDELREVVENDLLASFVQLLETEQDFDCHCAHVAAALVLSFMLVVMIGVAFCSLVTRCRLRRYLRPARDD